jgi:Cellulose biosynthesis protein BcsF
MTISKPLVQIVLLCGLVLFGCGVYLRQIMPNISAVLPETLNEPKQSNPTKSAFKVVVNNIEYTVKPVADYDISGVIVSR